MKNSSEQKQFAGLVLPSRQESGVAVLASAPEVVHRGGARSALEGGSHAQVRQDAVSQLISLLATNEQGFLASDELGALRAGDATSPSTSTELLQSSVFKHVTELRHTGATEMAVVLRPDADTHLSLRLSFSSSGEVTVQARCEQGDAQVLAAGWGEIRHSLAQQGVRLGALEFSPGHNPDTLNQQAGNGGPSPDGQPSSKGHGQPWPETLDDLPLVGSLTEPPTRRGVQRLPAGGARRWESWA